MDQDSEAEDFPAADSEAAVAADSRLRDPSRTMRSSGPNPRVFNCVFRKWSGQLIKDTYGGKAVLDCDGMPVFAELAMLRMLKKNGFEGAVWVDSYRRCFREAMPPATCSIPEQVSKIYGRISAFNGTRAGCWDVMAWKKGELSFIECKRKGRDRMTASEWKWLESAIEAGLRIQDFSICEWELE